MHQTFDKNNFHSLCDTLAKKDEDLRNIIRQYGYPPLWTRPNNFATLTRIILEQQVSLASAKAAFKKLKEKTGTVAPHKLIALTDADLRACYFSRQKTIYARHLAEAIINKKINLARLRSGTDEEIRTVLKQVKGIGNWTVDIYLMFALRRPNIFPLGDLAMVSSLKKIKQLNPHTETEEIFSIGESWQPFRSIATYLLWHDYLCSRNGQGRNMAQKKVLKEKDHLFIHK